MQAQQFSGYATTIGTPITLILSTPCRCSFADYEWYKYLPLFPTLVLLQMILFFVSHMQYQRIQTISEKCYEWLYLHPNTYSFLWFCGVYLPSSLPSQSLSIFFQLHLHKEQVSASAINYVRHLKRIGSNCSPALH